MGFFGSIGLALHLTCIKHSLQPQKSDPVSQTLCLTRVKIYRKKVAKTAVDMEDIYSAAEPASLVSDMGTLVTQPALCIPAVRGVAHGHASFSMSRNELFLFPFLLV